MKETWESQFIMPGLVAEPNMPPPKQRGQKDEKGYEEVPEELCRSSRPTTSRTQLD